MTGNHMNTTDSIALHSFWFAIAQKNQSLGVICNHQKVRPSY